MSEEEQKSNLSEAKPNRQNAVSRSGRKANEGFTPDFCPACKKEMRKWITDTQRDEQGNPTPETRRCVSMCITEGCQMQGKVENAIQNINNIRIEITHGEISREIAPNETG